MNGHACWGFNDVDGDFYTAAVAFLDEGRELGQQLVFVAGAAAEAALRDREPTKSMIASGVLGIMPFDAVYPGGRRMPSPDQWAAYAQATDHALAEGFTGLRVLAEVTALASDRLGTCEEHAAWETYADRRMAHVPLAALCCFDRSVVSDETLGQIGSAHPVSDRRLRSRVPFHLYAEVDALRLAGEVDATCAPTLQWLLSADNPEGDLVLDLGDLDFIDHTGITTIAQHAERLAESGHHLTLRAEPPIFTKVSAVLGLEW